MIKPEVEPEVKPDVKPEVINNYNSDCLKRKMDKLGSTSKKSKK